jgi:hypothetical protein
MPHSKARPCRCRGGACPSRSPIQGQRMGRKLPVGWHRYTEGEFQTTSNGELEMDQVWAIRREGTAFTSAPLHGAGPSRRPERLSRMLVLGQRLPGGDCDRLTPDRVTLFAPQPHACVERHASFYRQQRLSPAVAALRRQRAKWKLPQSPRLPGFRPVCARALATSPAPPALHPRLCRTCPFQPPGG